MRDPKKIVHMDAFQGKTCRHLVVELPITYKSAFCVKRKGVASVPFVMIVL